MPRIPTPALDAMTPAQRAVHDTIAGGPRGGVRGPLAVWLQRPQLAATAQALGQYCRYDSSLPPRLSELAILCMARAWAVAASCGRCSQTASGPRTPPRGPPAMVSCTARWAGVMASNARVGMRGMRLSPESWGCLGIRPLCKWRLDASNIFLGTD